MDESKLNKALDRLAVVASRLKDLDDRQTKLESRSDSTIVKKDFLPALIAAAEGGAELTEGVGATAALATAAREGASAAGAVASRGAEALGALAGANESKEDSARGKDPGFIDPNSPAPTRQLFDSIEGSSGMDTDTLEKIWSVIQSLVGVLSALAERLDGFEARADSLAVRGSDPIGEKRGERPVH